jgi:YesN/AraC family two-component response regulator
MFKKEHTKHTVMIVDDEALIRKTLRKVLDRAGGFEIVGEAEDGVEGVEKAWDLRPQVILLDVAMPRMDGLAAYEAIRKVSPDSKIVILTSFFGMEKEFLDLGVDGFLPKSARIKEVSATLKHLVAA